MEKLLSWYESVYTKLTHEQQQEFWKVYDLLLIETTDIVIKNEGEIECL